MASGRDDFGLRLVEFRRLANFGPIALVIREEPDVRSVLETLIRYEHTYNQAISIRLSEADGLATIRVDLELGEPAGTRQATELAVGALHHVHRQLHGSRWQPLPVCFSHPAPADISTHLRIFGHVTQLQREFAGIVLRAGDLAAPNKVTDPLLRPYAHQFLDTLGPPAEVTMVARVRELSKRCCPPAIARSCAWRATLASTAEPFSGASPTPARHSRSCSTPSAPNSRNDSCPIRAAR